MAGVGGLDPAVRADGHGRQRRPPEFSRRDDVAHPLLAAMVWLELPGHVTSPARHLAVLQIRASRPRCHALA